LGTSQETSVLRRRLDNDPSVERPAKESYVVAASRQQASGLLTRCGRAVTRIRARSSTSALGTGPQNQELISLPTNPFAQPSYLQSDRSIMTPVLIAAKDCTRKVSCLQTKRRYKPWDLAVQARSKLYPQMWNNHHIERC
jgi:hypothetical protein